MIKIATTETIKSLINAPIVLIDFWAPWCGPCKMLGPVIQTISNTEDDVLILKVNIDDNPELMKEYGISSIPLIAIFKNGQEVERSLGFKSIVDVQELINKNR